MGHAPVQKFASVRWHLSFPGGGWTMPRIDVLIYREADGSVPLRDWLAGLQAVPRERRLARLALLEEKGRELRRPASENLGGGVYELRVKWVNVQLRMLYFFHGRSAAVVSHGFAKEREVPPREIKLAKERMEKFEQNPARHTFAQEP